MKILFENLLSTATISSTNALANYPVQNLYHPFLRKRWQASGGENTITIVFNEPKVCNCFYFSWTNSGLTIKLYSNGTIVHEFNGSKTAYHFDPVVITRVEIVALSVIPIATENGNIIATDLFAEIVSSGEFGTFIGGIGIGNEYSLPPPMSFWSESFDDRSIVSESDNGQVLYEYIEPLRQYDFTIELLNRTDTRQLQYQYLAYGQGKPVWIDFETDELQPMYCRLTGTIETDKNKRQYKTKIKIKEAR